MRGTKLRKPLGILTLIATLGAGTAAAMPSSSAAEADQMDTVVQWNQYAADATLAAGGPPLATVLHMAMVHGAMYDAVNAIDGRHEPYLGSPAAQSWYSQDAAAAAAAYGVLASLLSAGQQAALETTYLESLAAIDDGPAKDGGIATGEAAAAAMVAARMNDGRFGTPGFPVGSAPGEWRQTLPAFVNDPGAWVADVTPFLIENSSQFRSDGPNPLTSRAYAEEFAEVKSFGSLTSTRRTADQTEASLFWGVGWPPNTWAGMFRSLAAGNDLAVADDARLFAMLYLTAADGAISCWDDKRHWGFWRPITAIREADTDGNDRTVADPDWLPLLPTPPYPDHPSAHTCISGSFVYTLQDFFGTDKMAFGGRNSVNGIERDFSRFSDAIKEITDARVWAGLHFRTADVHGSVIAKKVAHWRDKHYFQPT
jgi:hypothetical protein